MSKPGVNPDETQKEIMSRVKLQFMILRSTLRRQITLSGTSSSLRTTGLGHHLLACIHSMR